MHIRIISGARCPKYNPDTLPVIAVLILFISAIYALWPIVGLRYTTHDDIFFNISSYLFHGRIIEFSTSIARSQGRIQAYLNMPVILAVDGLGGRLLYDLMNVAIQIIICIAFLRLVWILSNITTAVCLTSITMLLFPLHYFFTFPQGFPVIGGWTFAAFLVSCVLAAPSKAQFQPWKTAGALILFSASLFGPEYNFLLHPLLMAVILFWRYRDFRKVGSVGLPFLLCWALCIALYIAYASGNTPVSKRTVPTFDPVRILETFLTLEVKAFVPTGLIEGIEINTFNGHGLPIIPHVLSYNTLISNMLDWYSFLLVLSMSWVLCLFAVVLPHIRQIDLIKLATICAIIAIIPTFVLSTSSLYQTTVLAGYMQGHLAAFYTDFGAGGLLFLAASAITNCFKKKAKLGVAALVAMILAAAVTTTFVYNNINRQAMSANRQKWAAFHELIRYIGTERTDLLQQPIFAPIFWATEGVSDIPTPSNSPISGSYWTLYASTVLEVPITILNSGDPRPVDALEATYFATQSGKPTAVLFNKDGSGGHLTLLNSEPSGVQAQLHGPFETLHIKPGDWKCKSVCKLQIEVPDNYSLEGLDVRPEGGGASSQLAQFALSRDGAFGQPTRLPKQIIRTMNK